MGGEANLDMVCAELARPSEEMELTAAFLKFCSEAVRFDLKEDRDFVAGCFCVGSRNSSSSSDSERGTKG